MPNSSNSTEISQLYLMQQTRLVRMIRNFEILSSPDTPKNSEFVLQRKLAIFDNEYAEFKQAHDEICIKITENERANCEYFSNQTQEKFDEQYFNILQTIDEAFVIIKRELTAQSNQQPSINSHQPKIKLPVLKPPTFSGKYIDWNAFSDQFDALIHSNPDVPTVQKMQYLLAALEGTAADVIKHLPVSAVSYEPARNLLKKKYENKRAIFMNAMNQLLNFQMKNHENISDLQKLASIIHETTQSLKNLDVTSSEAIIAFLAIEKLPSETRKEFEKQAVENENLPTIDDVDNRIQATIRTLELISPSEKSHQSQQSKIQSTQKSIKSLHFMKAKPTQSNSNSNSNDSTMKPINELKCSLCNEQHSIRNCDKFLEMSIQSRRSTAEKLKLCFNCLSSNHMKSKCQSKRNCMDCGSRHHTLLHLPRTENDDQSSIKPNENPSTSKAIHTSSINFNAPIFRKTLLSTAVVKVADKNGIKYKMRALIDLGGEASALSESACQTLQLHKNKCNINIDHLDDVQSKSNAFAEYTIESCTSTFKTQVSALVLKSLVRRLPSREIHYSNWKHIAGLPLADPEFNKVGPIDMILGAEIYAEIVKADIIKGPKGTPTAQSTELGWILFGKAYENKFLSDVSINTLKIDDLLESFFEIEDIKNENKMSNEDQFVIGYFQKNFQRDSSGRCIIKLPFRTEIDPTAVLGKSREIALRQFLQLERKFAENFKFKEEYVKNINDYLVQGHMIELKDTESDRLYYTEDGQPAYDCYYLPHHAVIREDSTSTRLRPVYNAGKATSNGNSLNSILFKGPIFLNDLIAILLNWRFHRIAFVSDIQQMYRQIRVHDSDITYQRILFRNDSSKPIKEYGINRLSFGLNYAPSGAIHTLMTVAEQNEKIYPETAETIKKDIYMDDTISGSHDIESTLRLQKELIEILSSAGFPLKKWASNSEDILSAIPESDREVTIPLSLNPDKKIKTLGIYWDTLSDSVNFNINYDDNKPITKQFILSCIAKIYDPLGLLSPVIAKAKIFMKKLWELKLEWNDPVTPEITEEWKTFALKLKELPSIKIPRWIQTSPKCILLQLHGFSDASMKAYGASIYLRCINDQNEISSNLIISKSRITPTKPHTIPRLELCAALLLAKLMKYTIKSIRHHKFNESDIFLWSDSQVVLHWINGDSNKWKTFVSNRINQILSTSQSNQWKYVSTKENPADLLSRGAFPSQLNNNDLWFSGPSWLKLSDDFLPSKYDSNIQFDNEHLDNELKPVLMNNLNIVWTPVDYLLHYCSKYTQLIRYTAWYRRFFQFLKDKNSTPRNHLTTDELKAANLRWISITQIQNFDTEISILRKNSSRKSKIRIWNLNPFLDENNFLRVGGRLNFARIKYNEKHPFILPKDNHFSKLLILDSHINNLHGGTQLTLSNLRQNYWILGGRNQVHTIIKNCFICSRVKGETTKQLMGDLPLSRLNLPSRPFIQSGMDLCGPIKLRLTKSPGSKIYKGYIAIFICMSTKAVNLQPIVDMTSESFLMSLQRFISTHGKPTDLYSDCGTNFIGAEKILKKDEIEYLNSMHSNVVKTLTDQGITFHFNPPYAPTFGGLWESNIRRIKYHLYRTMGEKSLTYDELSTVLARIGAILNSRPILPMSDDPDDFNYITPGHFLIGEAFTSYPEPDLEQTNISLTNRYRNMLKQTQSFSNFFRKQYFHTLQQRPKWLKKHENLKVGDLVLMKDERLPPLKWTMGRIIKTMPGKDGLVRVCEIKTASGNFTRAITKLAPLPTEEHQQIKSSLDHNNEEIESNHQITMLPLTLSIGDNSASDQHINSKPMTIIIEGNIGTGKSTFLRYLEKFEKFKVLPEPVPRWTDLNGHNLLQLMYSDTKQWAFPFQMFAALTLYENHLKQIDEKVKIMERSIYSSRYCFLEAHKNLKTFHSAQFDILDKWCNFTEQQNPIQIDVIIYLRSSPENCLTRIKIRGRKEETEMKLEYLQLLHQLHDNWLINKEKPLPAPVIIMNGNLNESEIITEYERVKNLIFN